MENFEEPTPTSIFILCTTDPQKIKGTILSRAQRYDFQRISHSGIVNRLKYIIDCENKEGNNYTYDEDAVDYIAKLADGGMRDSITMLEKVLGFSDNITLDAVTKSLSCPDYEIMFDLTDEICKMDKKAVIDVIETAYRNGIDLIKQSCKIREIFLTIRFHSFFILCRNLNVIKCSDNIIYSKIKYKIIIVLYKLL